MGSLGTLSQRSSLFIYIKKSPLPNDLLLASYFSPRLVFSRQSGGAISGACVIFYWQRLCRKIPLVSLMNGALVFEAQCICCKGERDDLVCLDFCFCISFCALYYFPKDRFFSASIFLLFCLYFFFIIFYRGESVAGDHSVLLFVLILLLFWGGRGGRVNIC